MNDGIVVVLGRWEHILSKAFASNLRRSLFPLRLRMFLFLMLQR